MLAAFIIPFAIITSLFIIMTHSNEGRPDLLFSLLMGVSFSLMVIAAIYL